VTDNNYTEILKGDLKEGQMVITGIGTESTQGAAQRASSSPPRRPMMFTP
jgi:hypothetical protein